MIKILLTVHRVVRAKIDIEIMLTRCGIEINELVTCTRPVDPYIQTQRRLLLNSGLINKIFCSLP